MPMEISEDAKIAVFEAMARYRSHQPIMGADAAVIKAWLSVNFDYIDQRRLLEAMMQRLMRLGRRRQHYVQLALRLRDIMRVLDAVANAQNFLHGASLEEFVGVIDAIAPNDAAPARVAERQYYRALFDLHRKDAETFAAFKKAMV